MRFALLDTRERNLTGRTGCGLCGTSTLEAAIRPVRRADPHGPRADAAALRAGMERLATMQPYNDASGAVHAAGLLTEDGGFTVREDVGRHNAIDKAVGAVARGGGRPHSLLVTSRASYEVVHKAAEVGCRLVAAISAPTALAVQLANEAGITLIGWARPPRLTVYSGELTMSKRRPVGVPLRVRAQRGLAGGRTRRGAGCGAPEPGAGGQPAADPARHSGALG